MNTAFKVDSANINPKFEGYKLDPFVDSTHIKRIPLSNINVNIDRLSTDSRIGFRDLQARIRQSHLFYGYSADDNTGTAFYVDIDYCLHRVIYHKHTRHTHIDTLVQLIKPLGSIPAYTEPDKNVPIESQSPSVVAINDHLILASNGVGDIELIRIDDTMGTVSGVSLTSVCYLGRQNEGISPVPCVLLTARQVDDKIMMVVYSRANSNETLFNITTLEMSIPTEKNARLEDGSYVVHLNTLHIQEGSEVPVYCAITPSGQRLILGSENKYKREVQDGSEEVSRITTPMEDVRIDEPVTDQYKWSQEGADITVQFTVPADITKSDITCKFVTDHLSLIVRNQNTNILSYPFRKLWGSITPNQCVWTLESSTLSLYITKSDENTRWPQLFDKDDGVLEDLTHQKYNEIADRLAKFTSDVDERKDSKLVHASQHPAATDMDEDVDDSNPTLFFSVYDTTGNIVSEHSTGNQKWVCSSYTDKSGLPSICLQLDVDGVVFSFTEEEDLDITIKHIGTFDAFAFVQASKRDARFIYFDPSLSFASVIESNRNAYLYYHHSDKRIVEKQTLIDLTKGEDANVIGVQLMMENILAVLTESHCIIIDITAQ
ncbi:hypothetical protein BDB01DRAFT_841337 [Pilobolus umbonatus]|nr:hypothetical protein BDB01DRAFT_841337 [Pilobolus umbonatus]